MSDQPPKDFPHPLNTEIEETVPVERISVDDIDEKSGKAKYSVKTEMRKQTVKYLHVPKTKTRCQSGRHVFRVLDIKKRMFGCNNCQYSVKVHEANYIFKDGKLIHRRTKRVV